jgi:hypothetical protein
MRYFLFIILSAFYLLSYAQLNENFSDGDFKNNPSWFGDTGVFIINASNQLQLNNAGVASTSILYTPLVLGNLDSLEWNVFVKQSFAGSSSNYSRIYLVSDQPDLKSSLNGYFLQFGEANANDAIELFKQTGTSVSSICRGTNASIASSVNAHVKVERRQGGLWKLYVDYTGGNNYTLDAQGTDNSFNSSGFFGFLCNYTSSNATKFFYDNIRVNNLIADTVKPVLLAAEALNNQHLILTFSETIDTNGVSNNNNYFLNGGIGNPLQAYPDTNDKKSIHLITANLFMSGQTYAVTVNNIKDLNSNFILANSSLSFIYIGFESPVSKDVVVNEIYADNTSTINFTQINSRGEYIELYNRSNKYFNLQNWTITAGSSTRVLPTCILNPGTYVTLCAVADTAFYKSYGPVVSLSSALPLTNAGSTLILKDNTGRTIDKISYSDSWYNDNDKKDGGYALEKINPNDSCFNQKPNWSGSNSVSVGGSPGIVNTVYSLNSDNTPPSVSEVTVVDSNRIQVCFNEGMDSASVFQSNHYFVNNGLIVTAVASISPSYDCIVLVTNLTIDSNITYLLSAVNVADCRGNTIAGNNSGEFSVSIPASRFDIIINEIMADPTPEVLLPNAEFVEVYNRSTKRIRMDKWKLSVGNSLKTISNRTIGPGEYLILAANSDTTLFSSYGKVSGISSTLSLTNGGATLTLLDSNAAIIDKVSYSSLWYTDNNKDDGGWTLERINSNDFCSLTGNWKASDNLSGGTPGKINSIQNNAPDLSGPQLVDVMVNSANTLVAFFNETLDSVFNENVLLFAISGQAPPNINSVKVIAPFYNQVLITLSSAITIGQAYTLSVNGLKDCKGNVNTLVQSSVFGRYRQALPYEIVINELMADPDPSVNLPNYEYIEIYNRTNQSLNLEKMIISSGSSKIILPFKIIGPGQYFLLLDEDGAPFYTSLPNKIEFPGFVTLPNEGGTLTLTDSSGNITHSISYTSGWYKNTQKDEGGWSLEQVDYNNPCGEEINWKASENSNGGTPGYVNSVKNSNPDQTAPKLVRVSVINPLTIEAFFNESIDSLSFQSPSLYQINNNVGSPINVKLVKPGYKSVILNLPLNIDSSLGYQLTVSTQIKDCVGNTLNTDYTSARFGIPRFPKVGDVLINEFLFDPNDGGSEFIELYNKSDKIIDLKYLSFFTYNSSGAPSSIYPISSAGYLFFPGDYMVLTDKAPGVSEFYNVNNELRILECNIPALSNTEGSVVLGDINNKELDRLDYNSDFHFPLLRITKGVSLERISLSKETNLKSNWHSASESVGFASPTTQNSQWIDGGLSNNFTLNTDIFSPDNDGYNDVLSLNYNLDKEGLIANVAVYDGAGRMVKLLVKNELLGTSGQFLWDGVNENNQKAAIGPYVIVVEITDIEGIVRRIRKTCVLAVKL